MKKPVLLGALALLIAAGAALFLPASDLPSPVRTVDDSSPGEARAAQHGTRENGFAAAPLVDSAGEAVPAPDGEIFAGGLVVCDGCGETSEKLELRDIPDAPGRIARILDSLKERSGMSSCDPRVAQLVALGDGAVNDLLEAFDAVNAERSASGNSGGAARSFALQYALNELLTEQDKEIILTYFEERAYFGDLALKFGFSEAGEIALRRLQGRNQQTGSSFWSSEDARIAASLHPSEAVPFLLQQIEERPHRAADYLVALAKGGAQVDLRQPLIRAIASQRISYSSSKLVPLALERGLPEGFDAALRVLRDQKMSYAHERTLEKVREYTGFTGTPEQTAQWIEQNRQRLFWNERGKMFVIR